MITFKEYLQENWQRAVLRKHGSVKPGHWNGKRFISDLKHADNESAGFDHERCKSINAQVEVNGKVVAGGLQKSLEETSSWKDKKGVDKSKPWAQQVRNSVEKERKRLERIKNTKGYDAYLKALKESNELEEMARQSKLTPDSTHGPMNSNQLVDLIGKTKANALFKHPWYRKHVGDMGAIPGVQTAHKVTVDKWGYPTVHSTSSFTFNHPTTGKPVRQMIQSNMDKDGGKVYQVHLFHNEDDERHSTEHGSGPVWQFKRSLHNDD